MQLVFIRSGLGGLQQLVSQLLPAGDLAPKACLIEELTGLDLGRGSLALPPNQERAFVCCVGD